MATNVEKAIEELGQAQNVSHYHFPFIKPLDENELNKIFKSHSKIITIEDGVIKGGFGSLINTFATSISNNNKIINLGISDSFTDQGSILELQQINKIDVTSILKTISTI